MTVLFGCEGDSDDASSTADASSGTQLDGGAGSTASAPSTTSGENGGQFFDLYSKSFRDSDGTTYDVSASMGTVRPIGEASGLPTDYEPIVERCLVFESERDAIVPFQMEVENTTAGFTVPPIAAGITVDPIPEDVVLSIANRADCGEPLRLMDPGYVRQFDSIAAGETIKIGGIIVIENFYQPAHPDGVLDELGITIHVRTNRDSVIADIVDGGAEPK